MPGSNCAFNSAVAIRRVFSPSNPETSHYLHVTRIFVPALLPPALQHQARTYASYSNLWKSRSAQPGSWGSDSLGPLYQNTRSAPPPSPSAPLPSPSAPPAFKRPFEGVVRPGPRVKTKLARLPRDDEIRERYVYMQPVGDEQMGEPQSVKWLLSKLDLKTESLQVVAMPKYGDPESLQYPVARIVNKKDEMAQKRMEKEQKKLQAAASKEKELELNWALAPNDIEHKLRTLQKFLAKGIKVQVLLTKKSKNAKATRKDAEALLQKVLDAVAAVPGSKEWKNREGQVLGTLKLFLLGKLQRQADAPGQADEGAEQQT